jgi:hypothetical protein
MIRVDHERQTTLIRCWCQINLKDDHIFSQIIDDTKFFQQQDKQPVEKLIVANRNKPNKLIEFAMMISDLPSHASTSRELL